MLEIDKLGWLCNGDCDFLIAKLFVIICCVEKLMMLEADVVLGTLEGGSGEVIPVMAHPPDSVSDLSLDNFLKEVMSATQKGHHCGIKLDFKSVEVLKPSLSQLKIYEKQVQTRFGRQAPPVVVSDNRMYHPVKN